MAEMQLFKLTPLYSHAINTILHGINTCLVYVIACKVFETRKNAREAALFAGLCFAVHPCLVEGVAWISGRFDLLATACLLAGMAIALNSFTLFRGVWVAMFALGAMLSKETGVLFAPLLMLLLIARNPALEIRSTIARAAPYLGAYAVSAILYFALRSQALGVVSYSSFGLSQLLSSVAYHEFWTRALSFYTFMSFLPFSSISPQHDVFLELESLRQHAVAVIAALSALIAILWFSVRRHTWALIWLGFYVGIFPVLGIFPVKLGNTIGAERFMYLPLAMLVIAVAALFLEIRERYPAQRIISIVGIALAGSWIVLSVFVSYTVTSMWENGIKLWTWQFQSRPENQMVLINYLVQLSNSRQPELEKEFEAQIEKIKSSHRGSLPKDVQLVYSAYLLVKNDPESLPYLEGLFKNSSVVDREGRKISGLSDSLYSGLLVNYAQALILFDGDLALAREMITKAKAIAVRGSEYQIVHPMIALEYLEGREEEALKTYKKNVKSLNAYNINKMHESIRTIVELGCKRQNNEGCKEKADGFMNKMKKVSME